MNEPYEQSFDLYEQGASLEERIDGQLYEPTLDGVSSAEFDLKWIGERAGKKRVELAETRHRFTETSDPELKLMVDLCEWELGELVQRQFALRQFLPRLRKLYQAAVKREFQPRADDAPAEKRPASVDDIFGDDR